MFWIEINQKMCLFRDLFLLLIFVKHAMITNILNYLNDWQLANLNSVLADAQNITIFKVILEKTIVLILRVFLCSLGTYVILY